MKVLITGSTANQSNPTTHQRATNFAGLLHDALVMSGTEVTWAEPSIRWTHSDLAEYDSVLVGVASPMALGSNRSYGALHTLSLLWGDNRLSLFLDAPEPNNITRAMDSISRNPHAITKPFFSYRKEFALASEPRGKSSVLGACNLLRNEKWPTTLVPGFPWSDELQYEKGLPVGAMDQVRVMNLDRLIFRKIEKEREESNLPRENRWMAEKTASKRWLKSLNLSDPVISLKADHRVDLHPYLTNRLETAMGFLHSPSNRGSLWWTPKLAIALGTRTPVFTKWEESKILGGEWSVLPSTFEEFPSNSKDELAQAQYDSYSNAVPSSGKLTYFLCNILGIEEEDNE